MLRHIPNTNIYFHKCTFPTLCPKGTQKPSNLQSSPKCWHDISNINVRASGRPSGRPAGPAVRRAEHSSRVQHSSRTVFIPTYIYRCDIIPPWLGKEHSIRVQHPSRTVFIPTYIYGCDIIPLWLGKEHIELRATFEPLTCPQYIVQKLSV